jgi:tetratricopeptide (TPR) repeat protein
VAQISLFRAFCVALTTVVVLGAAPAPYGDAPKEPYTGHFDNLGRCSNERLAPSVRLRYCQQAINNGQGIEADDKVLVVMAVAYREQGDNANSLATLDKVLAREPRAADVRLHDPDKLNFLATVYTERSLTSAVAGQYDDAMTDAAKALELAPDDDGRFRQSRAHALAARGLANFKTNNFAATASDCNAAFELNPKAWGILYLRGVAKKRLGDTAGDEDIATALQANPRIAANLANYGVVP